MLEYKDAKAIVQVENSEGKLVSELTTWKGDFIEQMLLGGNCLHTVEAGSKVTIKIEIIKISKSEDSITVIDDPSTVGC